MKLILIARVSDVEQRKALPAQKLKLKQYAATRDSKAEYYSLMSQLTQIPVKSSLKWLNILSP